MFTSSQVQKQGPQELSHISWYNSVVSAILKLVFTHILKLDQRKKQLMGLGKHSDDGFRNRGKLVPMSPGGQDGFLNVPQIILHRYLHTAFNLGTWWLQHNGEVHSPITQSYLRKQFCFLERFGALANVSQKALLKRWRQKIAFSYHSLVSTRDEKSVLQTTFLNSVAPENQINVCFIYLISWILCKCSPVADCDKPSEISS